MKSISLCLILLVSLQGSVFAVEAMNSEQFEGLYRELGTPLQRRELCLKAIDERLITVGRPLEVIEKMFGVNKDGWGKTRLQVFNNYILIHFNDFGGNRTDDGQFVSAPWVGSYLYVRYRADKDARVVIHYYISNVWMPVKGIEVELVEQERARHGDIPVTQEVSKGHNDEAPEKP